MGTIEDLVNKGRRKKVLPAVFGERSFSLTELVFFILAILVLWKGEKLGLKGRVKTGSALALIFLGMVIG